MTVMQAYKCRSWVLQKAHNCRCAGTSQSHETRRMEGTPGAPRRRPTSQRWHDNRLRAALVAPAVPHKPSAMTALSTGPGRLPMEGGRQHISGCEGVARGHTGASTRRPHKHSTTHTHTHTHDAQAPSAQSRQAFQSPLTVRAEESRHMFRNPKRLRKSPAARPPAQQRCTDQAGIALSAW